MIWLLSLALTVSSAATEFVTLPANGRLQLGNNLFYTDLDEITIDINIKSIDGSKFDVVFALTSCFYGYAYVEKYPKLPESEYNVASYQNKNTYRFTSTSDKSGSYCYMIHNNNVFQSMQLVYEFDVQSRTIYPEVPATDKLAWKLPLMIGGIIAGGLIIAIAVYCLVRAKCKPEKREPYVQMNDKLDVLISTSDDV
jgi:hypothetical protein